MTTNNSILIFHRSKQNSEEDLSNQQAFLEANQQIFGSAKIIDYMTGDDSVAQEIAQAVVNSINSPTKITVIINSFLSRKDLDLHYNL